VSERGKKTGEKKCDISSSRKFRVGAYRLFSSIHFGLLIMLFYYPLLLTINHIYEQISVKSYLGRTAQRFTCAKKGTSM